jgi:pimeloyl-ACP methyl ester carboxylesterase
MTVAIERDPVGVVLVHGLWHGSWVWDGVRTDLASAGVPSVAVDLPMTDLAADVAATRAALDGFGRSAVLVGHSYGGAVITAAGMHTSVKQLVYLAAFQLAEGESVGRTLPDLQIPATRLSEALRFSDASDEVCLDRTLAAELMYSDASEQTASAATARLRHVHRPVFSGVPDAVAWRHRPSTYVICSEDRTVHPDLQRAMAQRATFRQTWPSGHSPAATRTGDVAKLIAALTISVEDLSAKT